MSDIVKLTCVTRERAGKGAARAVRRAGRVPAVLYGDKKDPIMFSLEPIALEKEMNRRGFFSRVFDLDVDGAAHKGLIRDVQIDPVTMRPIHADFLRVSKTAKVTVHVTVQFVNEEASPGLKFGGVLNIVRHDVELLCPAMSIPSSLEIDLTGKEVGDSIHISEITLPEGVTPVIKDRDFTIATIAAPTVQKAISEEEEAVEGEGEEGGEA